jgi:hypothetical protein
MDQVLLFRSFVIEMSYFLIPVPTIILPDYTHFPQSGKIHPKSLWWSADETDLRIVKTLILSDTNDIINPLLERIFQWEECIINSMISWS